MTKPKQKWKFAIGTTSRVPGSKEFHYLIADFDLNQGDSIPIGDILEFGKGTAIIQKTEHGFHVYTKAKFSFEQLIVRLEVLRADQAWIEIGKQRGYFFLADKDLINFPWPVEHMSLHYAKKETHNT